MIRSYRGSDFAQVKLLVEKWYVPFFKDVHYAKFVAIEKKRVVGVAVASITLSTVNLDFIFVHEQCRSKGIGCELLRKVELWAKGKQADGLGLNCSAENRKAIRFYKSEGFMQVGKVYNYFSNKNWQLFFWKAIK